MVKVMADVFTGASVLSGLLAAWFWLWSVRIQDRQSPGSNPTIRANLKRANLLSSWAAGLTGVSIGTQAIATVLSHLAQSG